MLSWVREKLAEGRLRWQQSVQPQRNNTSPPPLPPPSAIESPATTPTGNPFRCIESDDGLHPIESSNVPIANHRPNANQTLNELDTAIKHTTNASNLKRYSHISRKSQRLVFQQSLLLFNLFSAISKLIREQNSL